MGPADGLGVFDNLRADVGGRGGAQEAGLLAAGQTPVAVLVVAAVTAKY
jgi:hypothetical protein